MGSVLTILLLVLCPHWILLDLAGAAYPTYATLRMLADDATEKEAPRWITYWALFSIVKAFGWIPELILSFIPFVGALSFYIKIAALVYLYSPMTQGAEIVLEKVLKPKVFPLLVLPKEN